jgi:hypothetical protein
MKQKFITLNKNKEYVESVSNIIGVNKCYTHGSFLKYGKEKACDVDCYETIDISTSLSDFTKYIERLYNNKKCLLIKAHFDIEHPVFRNIYKLLGFMDGMLNINNTTPYDIIIENINNIKHKETCDIIKELYEIYYKTKHIDDYIKLKIFVLDKVYPKWTFKQLLKGEKTYYDMTFKIKDRQFKIFYIELIYLDEPFKFMVLSNYIEFQKIDERNNLIIKELDYIVNGNTINYYYLSKILMFFFKKNFFSGIIRDNRLKYRMIDIYNEIVEFRERYGELNKKYCIVKNKMALYNIKIKKYRLKIKKYGESNIYNKALLKYTKLYDESSHIYNKGIEMINADYKVKYHRWISGYEQYIRNYIKYM